MLQGQFSGILVDVPGVDSVRGDLGAVFRVEVGELEECCVAGGGEEEFVVRLGILASILKI